VDAHIIASLGFAEPHPPSPLITTAVQVVDTELFEVVCVSPRNHFLFTPMLPSTAVGTVEFRSLLEPIRTSNPFVDYLEAGCDKLDVANKVGVGWGGVGWGLCSVYNVLALVET
jgi:hypothetical protein